MLVVEAETALEARRVQVRAAVALFAKARVAVERAFEVPAAEARALEEQTNQGLEFP